MLARSLLRPLMEKFSAPPPMPAGFEMDGPAFDESEFFIQEHEKRLEESNIRGLRLGLVYRDAKGRVSKRIVQGRKIVITPKNAYLQAHCEMRDSLRSFVIGRIEEVIDCQTGEVFEDVREFMSPFLSGAEYRDGIGGRKARRDNSRKILEDCWDGLSVLLYLANCDGEFHPSEKQVIARYIDWVAGADDARGGYDIEAIIRLAMHAITPDLEDALDSLVDLMDCDRDHAMKVTAMARELVDADGRLAEEEVAALVEIRQMIDEYFGVS